MSKEYPSVGEVIDREREVDDISKIYKDVTSRIQDRNLPIENMHTVAILSLATVLNGNRVLDTVSRYESLLKKRLSIENTNTIATLTLASVIHSATKPDSNT